MHTQDLQGDARAGLPSRLAPRVRAARVALVWAVALLGTPVAALAAPAATPVATSASPAASAPARGAGSASRMSGAEQACRAADHDHDGFISLAEYQRDVARSWAALSPDATGYVKLDDLAAIPGLRRSVLERLRQADADGDGRLSFKEVVAARMAQFDAADLDRDDRLSMKECIDHERKLSAEQRAQRRGKS